MQVSADVLPRAFASSCSACVSDLTEKTFDTKRGKGIKELRGRAQVMYTAAEKPKIIKSEVLIDKDDVNHCSIPEVSTSLQTFS